KSKLALRQVEILKSYFDLGIETEILEVITSGDQILNKSLSEIGGKGLFIKELEKFILDGSADIAVHSMKDMETEIAQNTLISAVLPRGDRSDVLLGKYSTLDDLPYNAVIGTSSVRRAAFTKSYRPDLVIKLLRGNVETRIKKLEDGLFDAIILAKAGLDRLKINVGKQIPKDIMPPAATQGAIAIQSTTNRNNKYEKDLNNYLFNINDNKTYFETLAERSLLKTLDGSCRSPISASAHIIENDRLKLYGAIARLDGTKVVKSEIVGLKKDAVLLGKNLGTEILSKANGEIIYK
ncbi:hydroxymethylbilane synthase, partial [Alphaproteobacteria bacterium]|nr:hydroxymethylbilane synthase [Alphaproteobacteria bacterium]